MILNDNSPMPFGKYKGVAMVNVPAKYLDWLGDQLLGNKNGRDAEEVLTYISANRDIIRKEAYGIDPN